MLSGLALPTVSRGAQTYAHPACARLSLNEILFGPSLSALGAIQSRLGDVCRYSDEVERRPDSGDRRVREPISRSHRARRKSWDIGLHLSMGGPRGGKFIYWEPGYTALVGAVPPGGGVVIGIPISGSASRLAYPRKMP